MTGPVAAGAPADLRRRALAAHREGDLTGACDLYAAYLAQVPGEASIWSNLGSALRASGHHDQALRAQKRARALAPDAPGVLRNLANVLADTGASGEALALRRRLLEEEPEDLELKAMIGRSLRASGAYAEAADWLRRAQEDHPREPQLALQLAFALLAAGDYGEGFEAYRQRWETGEIKRTDPLAPHWRNEDLTGRTVVVQPEQGFGDAVLILRLLPELRRRCARVLLQVEGPVSRLLSGVEGADVVFRDLPKGESPELSLSYFDLPRLGLRSPADIPAPTRLTVPPDSRDRAREIAGAHRDRFRVGVVWSGSATYRGNRFRSFSHRDLLPLADIPDVQLFSLYKGPALDAFRADGSHAFIIDAGGSDRDFADCAAMMEEMDLVVTSDTATAHIAGSLGVPTWVVLHWDPFWVYGHEGDTTPWYRSMRLFRQRRPGDWSAPFAELKAALQERIPRKAAANA